MALCRALSRVVELAALCCCFAWPWGLCLGLCLGCTVCAIAVACRWGLAGSGGATAAACKVARRWAGFGGRAGFSFTGGIATDGIPGGIAAMRIAVMAARVPRRGGGIELDSPGVGGLIAPVGSTEDPVEGSTVVSRDDCRRDDRRATALTRSLALARSDSTVGKGCDRAASTPPLRCASSGIWAIGTHPGSPPPPCASRWDHVSFHSRGSAASPLLLLAVRSM